MNKKLQYAVLERLRAVDEEDRRAAGADFIDLNQPLVATYARVFLRKWPHLRDRGHDTETMMASAWSRFDQAIAGGRFYVSPEDSFESQEKKTKAYIRSIMHRMSYQYARLEQRMKFAAPEDQEYAQVLMSTIGKQYDEGDEIDLLEIIPELSQHDQIIVLMHA